MPVRHIRRSTVIAIATFLLLTSSRRTESQLPAIQLPDGYASVVSATAQADNRYDAPIDCSSSAYAQAQRAASASYSCRFSPGSEGLRDPRPYDPGNFEASGSASFEEGKTLRARATTVGTVAARTTVLNTASAVFSDAMTVTGSYAPASVVFVLSIEGTLTNALNSPLYIDYGGRVDMIGWHVESDGSIRNGTNLIGLGLISKGDGSEQTMSVSVPWNDYAFGNTFAYQVGLVAFGGARNSDSDSPRDVFVDANFSNTARIASYALFDANGRDITALDDITFASSAIATPEPASLVLLGTGLLSLVAIARRKR